ncbi:hypothetical protein JRQ81_004283 [Phrynocephalus forsythii]|uniref:Uncharacterized protein n=1 Tax=Phrynocephalus forsythii TaxID=171643 RepID=A0A9Q0XF08_9SAUR|nr:hypothetical protein JRQ81_004283 [Phrynocephalus forsythii]
MSKMHVFSCRGLVVQFESLLHSVAQTLKRGQSLVVLIDGADLIHAAKGQLVSDWLPEQLPQRVSFVLSVSEDSALLGSLKRRADVVSVPLEPLDLCDRAAVVRKDLALYGKKLEESAFNNQMRLVLLKRGSRQPLYLTLLTQDLRLFALYEKLSERIQKLPVSLPLLLQHLLGCLEQDHGLELVAVALVSLWASRDGLTERDLYGILATWKELNRAGVTFEEALVVGKRAGSYPVAPFIDFLRSLRGLLGACGSPSEPPGSRLHLCGSPLRMAVEWRYLKKPGLDHVAHVLLAETAAGLEREETVDFFWAFLQRNMGLLSQNPLLLLQQAANEPDTSELCLQAEAALSGNRSSFLRWVNKPQKAQKTNSLILTLPDIPSCISVAPSGKLAAVGTTDGTLHLVDIETGQEVKSLLSTCDRISAAEFLSETKVCLGAFNGRCEVWSLTEGCRLVGIDAHKGQITDCCISPDRRLLATVSLDGYLKLWDSARGELTRKWDSFRPLNCVTFHPNGQLVATGGWDRTVTILDASEMSVTTALFLWDVKDPCQKTLTLWKSLLFCHQDWISSCAWVGPKLLSGSNDGTVRLWDPQTGQRLQEFLGHQSPICGIASEKDHVISVDRDGMMIAWDLQGVEKTRFLAHPGQANHCAGFRDPWVKEFTLAAAGQDGTVKLWKPLMMEQPLLLSGHGAAIWGAATSPASFVTISEDKTVRMWALPKEADEAKDLPPHGGAVTALAWSPDGEFAASGSDRGDLVVWHHARAAATTKVGQCCVRALAFTSSCTVLVASDGVSLWDIKTRGHDGVVGLTLKKLLRPSEEAPVLCVGKPSPRGPLVLALADGDFLVLPLKSESFQATPYSDGAWDKKSSVCFDITASEEEEEEEEEEGRTLHVWDSMNQPNLFRMRVTASGILTDTQDPEHIPWAPTQRSCWVTVARLVKDKFLFCADSEGYLWTQGKQNEEGAPGWVPDGWQRRKLHSDRITALHILGDRMVTASHDRDVKIWEGGTMKLLGQFRCRAPVSQLQPCPRAGPPLLLIAGDILGNVYFFEWHCFCR